METWLSDTVLSHNLFSDLYCVFCAESDYLTSNTKCGGGVLIAVSKSFWSVKWRYDFKTTDECMWVEIPVADNYSILTENYCFAPDCDVKVTENYLNFFRKKFNYTPLSCNCVRWH